MGGDPEVGRSAETADEVAAEVRPLGVDDDRLDMLHVEAERIAEQEDEEERYRKGQVKAPEVPDQVEHLLAGDRPDIPEIHAAPLLLFPDIRAMKASLRSASGRSGQAARMISSRLPEATILPSLIITIRPQWRASSM